MFAVIYRVFENSDRQKSDSKANNNKHNNELLFPQRTLGQCGQPAKKIYNLRIDSYDPKLLPVRIWKRLILKHLPYQERYVNAEDEAGLEHLRLSVANSISPLRGMTVNIKDMFIISDCYRALDIIIQGVLKRGSRIGIESPCDSGIRYLCDRFGIKIVPIPIDNEGIIVEDLPKYKIDLVYVTPSHQNPMGVTMSLQRRMELLAWASRSNAYIVECDTYGEFCYDASFLPSLYALDNEQRIIYLNTFSSWIGPGVNLGYLVVPSNLVSRVKAVKRALQTSIPWLDQIVAADFINSQKLFSHLRRIKQIYEKRRNIMIQSINTHFPNQNIMGYNSGRHITWQLPSEFLSAKEFQKKASAHGVMFSTLSDNYNNMSKTKYYDYERIIFLGYAKMEDVDINEGISFLKMICHSN